MDELEIATEMDELPTPEYDRLEQALTYLSMARDQMAPVAMLVRTRELQKARMQAKRNAPPLERKRA